MEISVYTRARALKHSVMVMLNPCQNLYHWVISEGTYLQVLMWVALVYYSPVLSSGRTCHILSPFWKIQSPVCWGLQGTLISGTIALLAFCQAMTSLFTLYGWKVQVKEPYICVCFEFYEWMCCSACAGSKELHWWFTLKPLLQWTNFAMSL